MNATTADSREWPRHEISLPATLRSIYAQQGDRLQLKGTLISFSGGGCAIRTTARLSHGEPVLVVVALELGAQRRELQIKARAVWGRDDFRIDTFYVHGLQFCEPLSEPEIRAVLQEESLLDVLTGSLPRQIANKEVA
ncbi:MAG: PilZ domain-containing protein [Deltaproteobacteria bacterium]|nr:PilZ domain-containing protein [Deltaproteobacteria bacterium]